MYHLGESVFDAWEGAIAEHLCKLSCCGNLDEALDLVQRLSVGGVANSETVEAEGAILVLIRGNIDIAVVVIVE